MTQALALLVIASIFWLTGYLRQGEQPKPDPIIPQRFLYQYFTGPRLLRLACGRLNTDQPLEITGTFVQLAGIYVAGAGIPLRLFTRLSQRQIAEMTAIPAFAMMLAGLLITAVLGLVKRQ